MRSLGGTSERHHFSVNLQLLFDLCGWISISQFFPSEQLPTPNLLGGPVTGREAAKSTTAQDLVMDLANPHTLWPLVHDIHDWQSDQSVPTETPRTSCKLRVFPLEANASGLQHFCSMHWMDRDRTQPTIVEPLHALTVMELNHCSTHSNHYKPKGNDLVIQKATKPSGKRHSFINRWVGYQPISTHLWRIKFMWSSHSSKFLNNTTCNCQISKESIKVPDGLVFQQYLDCKSVNPNWFTHVHPIFQLTPSLKFIIAKQQISACTAEHFREIAARKLLDLPQLLRNDAAM